MSRIAALAIAVILLSISTARADSAPVDKRFYIAPQAVLLGPDTPRSIEAQVGYGISVGKMLGSWFNIEANYEYFEPETAPGVDGPSLESMGLGLMVFPWRQSTPVYGLVRVAKGLAELDLDGEKQEADSMQYQLGVGYLVGLGDWPMFGRGPAIRMEARYQNDRFSKDEAARYAEMSDIKEKSAFNDMLFSLGLYIPLGPDPWSSMPPEDRDADDVVIVKSEDSDGDQIPDDMDQCPNTPAGATIDVHGCERDSDNDGVQNSADKCPNTYPGLTVDSAGCAPDDDNDGILNAKDQCPASPSGTPVLADGCALSGDCRTPRPGQTVNADGCVAEESVILKGVNFESDSAAITESAAAQLDEVARVLIGTTGIRFEVAGHTDSSGIETENLALSEQRAIAVKQYLVAQGVSSVQLSARGYGSSHPLVSNETTANRAINRRVELKAR